MSRQGSGNLRVNAKLTMMLVEMLDLIVEGPLLVTGKWIIIKLMNVILLQFILVPTKIIILIL